jgi:prevent-host-death family protein
MDMRASEFAVADAKARFSELLARAEAGEQITIKRHGRPVARIAPLADDHDAAITRRRKAREDFTRWRRLHGPTLGPGMTTKDLIDAGRR